MRLALAGATGMLGSAFKRRLGDAVLILDREHLGNAARLTELLQARSLDAFVNCAADVDAERAESDPDPAFLTNGILPGLLATVCRRTGVHLVHFSSTGCYGNWKEEPYAEHDVLRPTTVHHRSKQCGEDAVRNLAPDHLILRTGWLYGGSSGHKKNFVWHRLLEGAANPIMRSDTSQRGNPTFVDDVVEQTLSMIEAGLNGTFNCVAGGSATRFDYVSKIIEYSGLPCRVERAGAFARRAPISPNETAVNYRLDLLGLNRMPAWEQSLRAYVRQVQTWPEWAQVLQKRTIT